MKLFQYYLTNNKFEIIYYFLLTLFTAVIIFVLLEKINTTQRIEESILEKQEKVKVTSLPASSLEIKTSIPYWVQEEAFTSLRNNAKQIDYINLFWYFVNEEGGLEKYDDAKEDRNLLDFAKINNIKATMVVTNLPQDTDTTWDSKRVEYVLQSRKNRSVVISEILEKTQLGFDGVIVDFESVNASQKNMFTIFIKELTDKLHKNNLFLAVALHPKTIDKIGPGKFQDWDKIAKYADHLQVMGYGQHWDESEAGPIASIPWLEKIIEYANKQQIQRSKIFLGLPLYGYSWRKNHEDKAKGLTYKEITEIINEENIESKWDNYAKSPYFTYTKNGDNFEVWYENAGSIEEKVKLAINAGFAGITFWRLGEEDPQIWDMLRKYK